MAEKTFNYSSIEFGSKIANASLCLYIETKNFPPITQQYSICVDNSFCIPMKKKHFDL